MSTPNFSKTNAKLFYAIEDDQCDWIVDNVQEAFSTGEAVDKWDSYNRSYEGHIVSQINKTAGHYNICFDIIIRNGYYSGANLDWNYMITDENTGDQFECGEFEPGDLPKYVLEKADNIINKIEKIFARISTPLICAGIFSNGEAIYQKIK